MSQPRKILLLEDDAVQNEMLKEVLEASFYEVVAVNNGVRGLKEIMASDFDAILCDMMMPNLPGDMFYLAVQRIKPRLCRRFIFVTGNLYEPAVSDFITRIRGTVVEKPINIEQLIQTVDQLIQKETEQSSAVGEDEYQGERIDFRETLRELDVSAGSNGWVRHSVSTQNGVEIPTYYRAPVTSKYRVYLSAGIRGDEPGGPAAILNLFREKDVPRILEVWACPFLNPKGFLPDQQQPDILSFETDYRHRATPEVQAHIAWLARQPKFDVAICLREDLGSPGFYVSEINVDDRPSPAKKIIPRVAAHCPINRNPVINKHAAENGVVRLPHNVVEKTRWTEAHYLVAEKTRLCFILQSPSSLPLTIRAAALNAGVRAIFEGLIG